MKLLSIIFAFASLNAHAILPEQLQGLNFEAHTWGNAPCAECATLTLDEDEADSAQLLLSSAQLSKEQVYEAARAQIVRMNPSYIASPPSDFKTSWCPKYSSLSKQQKIDTWAWLLTGMAKFESSYKPREAYHEGQTDASLSGVVSTGLLQISFNSSQAAPYKSRGCPIEKKKDLIDPTKNLACGVAMIEALVERDGCISCRTNKGASAYWSVLRKPYTIRSRTGRLLHIGKKEKVITFIKENMPACTR